MTQKTIAVFPEAAYGPALNSVGIAQAVQARGHKAVFLSDRVVALSGRPGRIVADLVIDLPRPRKWEEVVRDERFAAYRDQLTQSIHANGHDKSVST